MSSAECGISSTGQRSGSRNADSRRVESVEMESFWQLGVFVGNGSCCTTGDIAAGKEHRGLDKRWSDGDANK
jgi:hypothetical protein